jgi:nitroreductase
LGGAVEVQIKTEDQIKKMDYADFIRSRHSMRHFSNAPIEKEKLERVAKLAQHTPSACNRQGWQMRIIINKDLIKEVLKYQNGNEGFGHQFTGLILITGDVRCSNHDRELFQVYIDSGMYAQSVLNALHYEHIASCPLSASLTSSQEEKVRDILNIEDAEVLVMFIGIGNYPDDGLTTRSERRGEQIIFFDR